MFLSPTLTGIPDPPVMIAVNASLDGKYFYTSWDYARIPTVDVTLYWSLSFFEPSQLSNMTTTLLNTNTHNYTLQGVRSCDHFRLCIRAENVVGNSSWSCFNDTLPYLPRTENVEYSIVSHNESIHLNVRIMVRQSKFILNLPFMLAVSQIPQECHSSMNLYCLKVTSKQSNASPMYYCLVSEDNGNIALVVQLDSRTAYTLNIVARSNIGEFIATTFSICK